MTNFPANSFHEMVQMTNGVTTVMTTKVKLKRSGKSSPSIKLSQFFVTLSTESQTKLVVTINPLPRFSVVIWNLIPTFVWRMGLLQDCSLADVYPTLGQVYSIVVVIPFSAATAERSFSALERVKTRIRSTMVQERLESFWQWQSSIRFCRHSTKSASSICMYLIKNFSRLKFFFHKIRRQFFERYLHERHRKFAL